MSKAQNYFERYRNRYSDQAPTVVFELHATAFRCRYLDIRPMTLTMNCDLDILKMYMYLHIKN